MEHLPVTLERLKLGIGYLCHRHPLLISVSGWRLLIETLMYHANALMEATASPFIKSLANIMNVTELDGKEFKKGRSDTFAFANVLLLLKSVSLMMPMRSLTPLVSSLAPQVISMCAVCIKTPSPSKRVMLPRLSSHLTIR